MIFKITNGGVYTGFRNFKEKDNLKIFPNPSNGIFFIYFPIQVEKIDIEIFDLSGVCVFKFVLPFRSGCVDLNLSGLKSGIYIYKINSGSKIWTGKLIIN